MGDWSVREILPAHGAREQPQRRVQPRNNALASTGPEPATQVSRNPAQNGSGRLSREPEAPNPGQRKRNERSPFAAGDEAASDARLPANAFRGVRKEQRPSIDRADELCRALGVRMTIGSTPTGDDATDVAGKEAASGADQ